MKDERDKDNCFQCTHCSGCVHSNFICILSISLTWSLDASFSKISMSHSMISTALFYKWDNEHIKILFSICLKGELTVHLAHPEISSHSKLMFWCHSLYRSRIIKLYFLFLEPSQWIIILPCHFLSWCFLKSTVWTGLGWFLFFLYWKIEEEVNSISEEFHQTRHVLAQMELFQTYYKSIFLLSSADFFIPTKNSRLFQYVKRVSSSYKIMEKKNLSDPSYFRIQTHSQICSTQFQNGYCGLTHKSSFLINYFYNFAFWIICSC